MSKKSPLSDIRAIRTDLKPPKIVSISEEKGILTINLSGDTSYVNSVRRILLSEIKTYSLMGDLTIMSNTSQVFKNNELVSSRISMIPIYTEEVAYNSKGLQFYVCADGDPKKPLVNSQDSDLDVSAYSLQVFDEHGNPSEYDIKDIIRYDLPILKLRKGEEFHFRGKISEGIGDCHATWNGAQVTYGYSKEGSDRWNPEEIELTVRGNGHYLPKTCMKLCLDVLESKLLLLQNLLDNPMISRETKVELIPDVNIDNFLRVKIHDVEKTDLFLASHTIGNLVASHMYYLLTNKTKGDLGILSECMASYVYPHPLDPIIYFHIRVIPGIYPAKVQDPSKRLLNDAIENLLNYTISLKSSF